METIRTQAITFDVGGTLINPCPSVGEIYAQVANKLGYPDLDSDQINRQFGRAWKEKGDFQYTENAWSQLVVKSFDELIPATDARRIFPEIYRRFEDPEVWRIHDDVLPALDELAGRGFRLAIISNWDNRLRPLLTKLKLLSFFETATISSDIGFTKPSSVLFEHTLKKLGLPSSSVVHVGDSPKEDIDGAEGAGVTGILIRRRASNGSNTISDLRELGSILKEDWADS